MKAQVWKRETIVALSYLLSSVTHHVSLRCAKRDTTIALRSIVCKNRIYGDNQNESLYSHVEHSIKLIRTKVFNSISV